MGPLRRRNIFLLACSFLLVAVQAGADEGPPRTVVVLLFDGFAPTMLDGNATPALDRMRREGAWTHHFVHPFPASR